MTLKSLMYGSAPSGTRTYEITYAFFRFYCGFSIAIGAGLSKVFHKIDEAGGTDWGNLAFGVPDWFVKQVGEIGFTFISPSFWAYLAVYGEFIGGLLIAVGLFTRISALQLAFQFFVVSFLWYDAPMPFDMYYQQLIFWSFVLISALGGGQFSVDNWLKKKALKSVPSKNLILAAGLLVLPFTGFSQKQTEPLRVSFTISNPGLKTCEVDIRHYDYDKRKTTGYGYELGGLSSHAVNMPVGTRVYRKKGSDWQLAFVLTAADNGRKFDIYDQPEITREQWLQVSYDEMNAKTTALEKAADNPTMEATARAKGYQMITFQVAGKSLFPKQVYVRVQLPYDDQKSNTGFSKRLSRASSYQVSYPVGSKVYICDGEYWNGNKVKETLLFTVDAEKQNYLFRF
jgi:uncharacterized membrane protein YphA (DoxX/SURF4 family)